MNGKTICHECLIPEHLNEHTFVNNWMKREWGCPWRRWADHFWNWNKPGGLFHAVHDDI